MKTVHSRSGILGFTTIEILIAITVSMFMLTGVIQVFISSKQSYRTQEAMSDIQETGRFAMQFITNELRMAGFTGCQGSSSGSQTIYNNLQAGYGGTDVTAALLNAGMGLESINNVVNTAGLTTAAGTNLASLGLVVGTAAGNVVAGTDLIVIRRQQSCPGGQVTESTTLNGNIKVGNTCGLGAGDIILISDCLKGDIFAATTVSSSSGTVAHAANFNTDPQLDGEVALGTYSTDANIHAYQSLVYFIGVGASGEPSLWRTTLAGTAFTPQELVEGVQDMQIVFGENVGAAVPQAIRYVPPAPVTAPAVAVTDYADVKSVRLWLMVRSEDNITETTQGSLTFAGTTYTPPDKRLRKVFSTTVGLRNRIN